MSASAPAPSASKNIGRVEATWTNDTMNGSVFRTVINQPEAALYIQVPMLETTVAVQITVNALCRNAPQGERATDAVLSPGLVSSLRCPISPARGLAIRPGGFKARR